MESRLPKSDGGGFVLEPGCFDVVLLVVLVVVALLVDGFGAGDLRRPVRALLRLIFFCFSGSLYGDETAASFSVLMIASGWTSS